MRRFLPLICLAAAACASPPPPSVEAGLPPDLAAARRTLLASQGPIPVVAVPTPAVLGPTPDATVARLASDATQWAAAGFRPAIAKPISGPYLLMRFAGSDAPAGDASCGTLPPAAEMRSDPTRLQAVLCDGSLTVAEAVGVSQGAGRGPAEALVTDTTARLFPQLNAQSSPAGWSYGSPGISLGGWFGSGGDSGVGIGLGF